MCGYDFTKPTISCLKTKVLTKTVKTTDGRVSDNPDLISCYHAALSSLLGQGLSCVLILCLEYSSAPILSFNSQGMLLAQKSSYQQKVPDHPWETAALHQLHPHLLTPFPALFFPGSSQMK